MEILELSNNNKNFDTVLSTVISSLYDPGCFVLVPTDTVYGFVCLWNDEVAKININLTKNRKKYQPLQMLVDNVNIVKSYYGIIPKKIEKIINSPYSKMITFIVPTQYKYKIGFRISNNKLLSSIVKKIKIPLAATSVNISNKKPIDNTLNKDSFLNHIRKNFDIMPNLIIYSKNIDNNINSTIIDIDIDNNIKEIREGIISFKKIYSIINK